MVVPDTEVCEEQKGHKDPAVQKGHRGQDSHGGYRNPVVHTKVARMGPVQKPKYKGA